MLIRTTGLGFFIFCIAACSGGGDTVVNAPPLVSAGDPQTVTEGTTVSVTASASDPNGDSMTYAWSQVSGPMVSLSSTNSLTTSFEAPNVNDSVDIVLRLAVTDSRGASATSDIRIAVYDTARPGPSSQGIPDNGADRRNRARNGRSGNRPMVDSREVRTYDGTNNNQSNPDWGATFAHLQRFATVDYADGVSAPAGPDRPSARAVSNGVADQPEGVSLPNTVNGTDFVWQWGQFMDLNTSA